MNAPSNGSQWLKDIIKYVIGGTIAAGLVTFVSFLVWRGAMESHFTAIEQRLSTIEAKAEKIDSRTASVIDTQQYAAVLVDVATLKRQVEINTTTIVELKLADERNKKLMEDYLWSKMRK